MPENGFSQYQGVKKPTGSKVNSNVHQSSELSPNRGC